MSDKRMEKEQFYLMAYAVAMADYDRALTIAKELKAYYVTSKDNTLASIFEKIEKALVYSKNEEYAKEQELWREISVLATNIDNTLSVFATACYYGVIADSAEGDTAKKLEYQKKVKREFEKIGDEILILIASAEFEELPEKSANIYEKIANEFNKANLGDLANQAMGNHYFALATVAGFSKEGADLFKKAADVFKAGKNDDLYHAAMGAHYSALATVAGFSKEGADLYEKAADVFKAGKNDDLYHGAMGMHYSVLARATESLEERAKLNKKAADEFKEGKNDEQYHKEMAWHHYLSSLLSDDKRKIEDLKSRAVKETDWLFLAKIALSLSKITKKTGKIIYLIKDAISSYERYSCVFG